jgi:hypothetical protein
MGLDLQLSVYGENLRYMIGDQKFRAKDNKAPLVAGGAVSMARASERYGLQQQDWFAAGDERGEPPLEARASGAPTLRMLLTVIGLLAICCFETTFPLNTDDLRLIMRNLALFNESPLADTRPPNLSRGSTRY